MSKKVDLDPTPTEAADGKKSPSYPRLEADVVDAFGQKAYGVPKGTSKSANENEIGCDIANAADLLPGEKVIAQFNVFFPGKMIPFWLFLIYAILTCGLFVLYFYCTLYFQSKGCCLPTAIGFERGRLVVTSHGRILTWKTNFEQQTTKRKGMCLLCGLDLLCMRLICGPEPVTYAGLTETGQYLLADVAEIMYVTARNPSFCCGMGQCAESYQGTLRIFFNKFDAQNMAPTTLKTSSVYAFEAFVNSVFNNSFFFGDAAARVNYIEITSTKESDSVFDYENPKADGAFQNLAAIYSALNELVVQSRPRSAWSAPSAACQSKLLGADVKAAKWASLDTVSESSVALPTPWAALAPGEAVVAAQSNMYMMSCADWALSFLTCGVYFCVCMGEKRKIRPSLVLTSHRLLEVTPAVDDGCAAFFPSCLTACCCPVVRGMVVRSLYPRHVFSGVLTRDKMALNMSVCTDMGAVYLTFDQIPSGGVVDTLVGDSKFDKKLAFCHALMSASSRTAEFQAGEDETLKPTPDELNLFPLGTGEEPLARYTGKIPDDACFGCCNKEQTWHPGCCLCCTCGVSPMFSQGSVTLTTTSLYTFKQRSNEPWACWMCLVPFVQKYDWQLLWTPLSHLVGTSVDTVILGDDSCKTRCCKSNAIGQNCCPVTKSAMTLKVASKSSPAGDGVLIGVVGNLSMFKSVRVEPELKAFREAVARVQGKLHAVGPALAAASLGGAAASSDGAPKAMLMSD